MLKWFIKTKEGLDIHYYCTKDNFSGIPLNEIEEFDCGSFWSIDAGNNDEIFNTYQEDPEDNSFVLIPKDSVIEIYTIDLKNLKKIIFENI